MQLKSLTLGIIFSLFSFGVMAGSGHDHGHSHSQTPVNQATAKLNATKVIGALVKRNKLDKSWASVIATSVKKKTFKGNPEWIAVFVNKKINDTAKQKLHVFLTLGGDFVAINYSGK